MSQVTSAARVGARTLNRPPSTTTRPRLRVVTGAPPRHGSAAFGVLCAALLAAGLIGLLLLNTQLAQGSFTLHDLRAASDQLADTEDALTQSLASSKSPANLAAEASGMGMVPAQSVAFLRLADGRVIGVAKPAKAVPGFTVVRGRKSAAAPAPARVASTVPPPRVAKPPPKPATTR